VSNIIRLKNQAQQMVRALKLEFLSSKVRSEISEPDEIGTMQMKYKVVEYYARVNVFVRITMELVISEKIAHIKENQSAKCMPKNVRTLKSTYVLGFESVY
jgi:hypothetical protein